MRVLVLGGTGEGRRLAEALADVAGVRVVSSVAGRVRGGPQPAGEVRTGGFGGAGGLAAWLVRNRVGCVVDATHPFAAVVSAHAAQAAAGTGVPLLALRRPGWTPGAGDRWVDAGSMAEAAGALAGLGERVFLSVGRQQAGAFAGLDGHWFLLRAVEPPQPPLPRRRTVVLARGPFTVAGELALLREHRIEVLVSKDSGGGATRAKLTAARLLGLPVVLVRRPPLPEGVASVPDVAGAVAWVRRQAAAAGPGGGGGAAGRCP
ncbi:cobalt-precorrin-6A reductase [Streptomyces sp. TRM 70351]|uniref:cobalt-precorrin-6A reductase n=1 Tax=Streptomyces sp. TRM 70351 TaxID=3116552 RepID=UPI002E7B4197|nr:cobalt-precorrin-6A reductase [Streptomyces sp. TRM 70351]MEE1930051.1 cobalt-precorrin-6A reductase [Streptomyces sp. TRM 70351]